MVTLSRLLTLELALLAMLVAGPELLLKLAWPPVFGHSA